MESSPGWIFKKEEMSSVVAGVCSLCFLAGLGMLQL
jgi:hypothetical protein